MEIVSIVRKTHGAEIPSTFTLGENPKINGQEIEGQVISIKFFETGYCKGAAYRGPCYVVKFEGISRVIPANNNIIEVGVQLEKSSKPEAIIVQ